MFQKMSYSNLEMVIVLKTMLDVRNLLKQYGIFIYTRDRIGDLELMQIEISELFDNKMILSADYHTALLIIRQEKLVELGRKSWK